MIARLHLTRRPSALLLDAGDTLIFFDGHAMAAVLAEHGVALAGARIEAAMHAAKQRYQAHLRAGGQHDDGWYVVVREALLGAGATRERIEPLLPAVRAAHDAFNFWRRVPEHVPEALARARDAGMRLGIVSNSEGKLVEVLTRVGLAQCFDAILDSHLEGVHKPDPEIFRRALVRVGTAAEDALFAGDIPDVDLAGAASAGVAAVLIDPHGYYAQEPYPAVRSVIELVDELLALPA